jgi:hypothetical protein
MHKRIGRGESHDGVDVVDALLIVAGNPHGIQRDLVLPPMV